MKKIEVIIITVLMMVLVAGMSLTCSGQNNRPHENYAEFIGDTSLMVCLCNRFDLSKEYIETEKLQILLEKHFKKEIFKAGYPIDPGLPAHFQFCKFDKNGHIIPFNKLTRAKPVGFKEGKIIGDHPEKTVFHYEIE